MIISPFLFLDLLKFHQFGSATLPETLSEYVWYAGREVWKGTLMIADLEQVDKIDESPFHNIKFNVKEMISPNLVTIPKYADGQLKFVEGDQVLRTSTSIGVSVPRTRRSSRRLSWRIRRVSTNHQSKKSLHINTVFSESSAILTKRLLRKTCGKTCHELLQQADLRRLPQVKQVAFMVSGLSTSSSSRLPSSTSMTPSRQEIDHPTSSSSSSTSPTTTVSSDSETRAREDLSGIDSHRVSVSSGHVERQERGDPCSSGIPEEELLTNPTNQAMST